jgi:hypothetical protein
MVRTFASALMLSVLSLAGAGVASAQTGPSGGSTPPVNPLVNPAPAVAGELSEEAVAGYLRSLDPNLKVATLSNGGKQYTALISRDGWTFEVKVQVVRGRIWLLCHLGKVINSTQTPQANLLMQLLQLNDLMGPTYFSYEKFGTSGVKLCVNLAVDRTISLDRFKREMDGFLKKIKDSYPGWGPVVNSAS